MLTSNSLLQLESTLKISHTESFRVKRKKPDHKREEILTIKYTQPEHTVQSVALVLEYTLPYPTS